MLTFEQIVDVVCNHLRIEKTKIFNKNRKRERVYARQMCMLMMTKYTKASLKAIGNYFDGKDHTTVIHAKTRINDLADAHEEDKQNVHDIIHLLEVLNNPSIEIVKDT